MGYTRRWPNRNSPAKRNSYFRSNVFSHEYAELSSFSCDEINNNLDQESRILYKKFHIIHMESADTGFDLGLVFFEETRNFEPFALRNLARSSNF